MYIFEAFLERMQRSLSLALATSTQRVSKPKIHVEEAYTHAGNQIKGEQRIR